MSLWVVIPMSGFSSWRSGFVAKWWDLKDGGDQWVFELEISGLVGSNFWVCKSIFGFDFGWCMLISGF